jgi:hypothetical protein
MVSASAEPVQKPAATCRGRRSTASQLLNLCAGEKQLAGLDSLHLVAVSAGGDTRKSSGRTQYENLDMFLEGHPLQTNFSFCLQLMRGFVAAETCFEEGCHDIQPGNNKIPHTEQCLRMMLLKLF